MAVENKRMQQRNDTAANWSSVNPVLAAGEVGYDTTNKKFKMGDGTSNWNTLDYYEAGAAVTEGDGIDISNLGVISIDARSTQFAFQGGEMYLITTGDGGFVTRKVLKEAIDALAGATLGVLVTI